MLTFLTFYPLSSSSLKQVTKLSRLCPISTVSSRIVAKIARDYPFCPMHWTRLKFFDLLGCVEDHTRHAQ